MTAPSEPCTLCGSTTEPFVVVQSRGAAGVSQDVRCWDVHACAARRLEREELSKNLDLSDDDAALVRDEIAAARCAR